jgi:hypothetical protein
MRNKLALVLIVAAMFPGIAAGDVATANQRAKSGAFDGSGNVRCAQEVGQSFGTCSANVARADDAASVIVTFPNGFARRLMFLNKEFLRGNATMSGVGTDMEWSLSDGIYAIRVDDQRFEISETLVNGE